MTLVLRNYNCDDVRRPLRFGRLWAHGGRDVPRVLEHHEPVYMPVVVDDDVDGEQGVHQFPCCPDADGGPAERDRILAFDHDAVYVHRLAVNVAPMRAKNSRTACGVARWPCQGTVSVSPGISQWNSAERRSMTPPAPIRL